MHFRFAKSMIPLCAVAIVLGVFASSTHAVIVYGGTGRNTTSTGSPTVSGWQYEGSWGSFLGTPISSNLFITAGHVGGAVGQALVYNGASYTTTASYDDPNSDLRIW